MFSSSLQLHLPLCACACSYRTGWLARGDLQQDQANHRGAVWPLHLDPILGEALSFLPSPLHRRGAPPNPPYHHRHLPLPPRDPTRAQIAPPSTPSSCPFYRYVSYQVLVSSLCYSRDEKEVLSPLLWLCTPPPPLPTPCMSFSTTTTTKKNHPFKTGNAIPKESVYRKAKKGKGNNSFFVNWDWLKIRMFYMNLGVRRSRRKTGLNRTEVEYFVNVHQVTFKKKKKKPDTKRELKTNGGLFYLPLYKTGSNGALLMVLLEESTLVSNWREETSESVQTGDLFITNQLVVCQFVRRRSR